MSRIVDDSFKKALYDTISAGHVKESELENIDYISRINRNVRVEDFQIKKISKFELIKDVDKRVETVSNSWIDIEVMKKCGKYNSSFVECVNQLKQEGIVGWKKCCGDGNCYYRAVIVKYMEAIHKVYSPISYIIKFKQIIEKVMNFYSRKPSHDINYISACEAIINILNYTIQYKEAYPFEMFMQILDVLQNKVIDIALVRTAKLIAYYGLLEEQKNENFKEFGLDFSLYQKIILTMNEEAEGFVLIFLPLVLDCQVIQFNIFKVVQVENFPHGDRFCIKIPICRRGGHYDILYTIQEMEDDMYCFETGEYHILLQLANDKGEIN
ncbi:hypothetical protein SteCoe_4244 [Stentor coeruleus]|uniref:ubiquitinyl hydrolase 1 n=1 Tax=Stentor coeruleus TaxID=5963 RepID=A0A1R2CV71_9CILI|nr:hypothetical protein SteCoe_4244 [Stentor coeruleus]